MPKHRIAAYVETLEPRRLLAGIHAGGGHGRGVQSLNAVATLGVTQGESFYVTSLGVSGGGLVDLDADITIEGKQVEAPARSRLGGQTS